MNKITAFDVAEYFIYLANRDGKKISNKKLQKIVYYAQAWTLALTEDPLFLDRIEAWIHGPAISSLYKKYKKFGFNPVGSMNSNFNPAILSSNEIMNEVWRVYGKYDADYLEVLTHEEDPWIYARSELDFNDSSTNEISMESMKNFYAKKLKDASS